MIERSFVGTPGEHFPGNSQHATDRHCFISLIPHVVFISVVLAWGLRQNGFPAKRDPLLSSALFSKDGRAFRPQKAGQCERGPSLQPP